MQLGTSGGFFRAGVRNREQNVGYPSKWSNYKRWLHIYNLLLLSGGTDLHCATYTWRLKYKLHPPPLSHFTLQQQHVTRWEGLLAVPRRWSSTCQGLASVIYEASQPQPSRCSRDAGGLSLLKMFFHFLLDLRLSECIKELNLDRETVMHEGLALYPPQDLL